MEDGRIYKYTMVYNISLKIYITEECYVTPWSTSSAVLVCQASALRYSYGAWDRNTVVPGIMLY